ncbi:GSCOCG00006259001-RA-CDS [Cotesia congregata]|nr:GSCOCG00006259001-RA-CDS [Cotesia congregata]
MYVFIIQSRFESFIFNSIALIQFTCHFNGASRSALASSFSRFSRS